MSTWVDESVACPRCGKTSLYRVWFSRNAQIDPQARQDLLDNKLMVFTCQHCGASERMDYPIMYHDMEGNFMIQLVCDGITPDDPPQEIGPTIDFGKYRFRVVDSPLALQEKIRVFEAGADDRVMELFKAYMQHQDRKGQYPRECTTAFAGFRPGKKELEIVIAVVTDRCDYVVYPVRKYEAVHHNTMSLINIEQNVEGPHPVWRRIDRAYARKMLHYDN